MPKYPDKALSNISPRKMIAVFENNTPLHAKTLAKEFIGLNIEVAGIISSVDDVGGSYVTFCLENEADDVHISANFDKPFSQELATLNEREKIKIRGRVFNVGEGIVVLDHSELVATGKNETSVDNQNKVFYKSFLFWTIAGVVIAFLGLLSMWIQGIF